MREALAVAECNVLVAGRQEIGLRNGLVDLDLAMIRRELADGRAPDVLIRQPRAGDTVLLGYEDISPLFQEWVNATAPASRRNWSAGWNGATKTARCRDANDGSWPRRC